ncbi:hypothetical protein CesoFtcFv8_004231 [Champsocephalus esox]|uniref:Uncharacterized protein n=1 Tax=Champsocephalus esox TaxID=159716 RepID=A0AAN8CU12_9TELE|nr:hypothetical protein CesoFtcFv8_004231 [Champsocephalus esox]
MKTQTSLQPLRATPQSFLSAGQKSSTLVSAGRELPKEAVLLPRSSALNPNALAKCKRGIRVRVKTAYSEQCVSESPFLFMESFKVTAP